MSQHVDNPHVNPYVDSAIMFVDTYRGMDISRQGPQSPNMMTLGSQLCKERSSREHTSFFGFGTYCPTSPRSIVKPLRQVVFPARLHLTGTLGLEHGRGHVADERYTTRQHELRMSSLQQRVGCRIVAVYVLETDQHIARMNRRAAYTEYEGCTGRPVAACPVVHFVTISLVAPTALLSWCHTPHRGPDSSRIMGRISTPSMYRT
ncbi:hypothetical protein F5Y18DRAFT_385898 [Xylariaceae sp. FL1019]|nr:hypothetical protein F5Y18DRAFT_385898 [Xylariaceae sp. FL1019]